MTGPADPSGEQVAACEGMTSEQWKTARARAKTRARTARTKKPKADQLELFPVPGQGELFPTYVDQRKAGGPE